MQINWNNQIWKFEKEFDIIKIVTSSKNYVTVVFNEDNYAFIKTYDLKIDKQYVENLMSMMNNYTREIGNNLDELESILDINKNAQKNDFVERLNDIKNKLVSIDINSDVNLLYKINPFLININSSFLSIRTIIKNIDKTILAESTNLEKDKIKNILHNL